MKTLILMIFLTFISAIGTAQNLCLEIDSIEINYIPWQAKSPVRLNANDLISCEYSLCQTKTTTEHSIINEFCNLDLTGQSNIIEATTIDVRMLILVHYGKEESVLIALDKGKNFLLGGKLYSPNLDLIKWIDKYVIESK